MTEKISLTPEEQELAEKMVKEVSVEYRKARDTGDTSRDLYSDILLGVIVGHGIQGSERISKFRSAIAAIRAQRSKEWKEKRAG